MSASCSTSWDGATRNRNLRSNATKQRLRNGSGASGRQKNKRHRAGGPCRLRGRIGLPPESYRAQDLEPRGRDTDSAPLLSSRPDLRHLCDRRCSPTFARYTANSARTTPKAKRPPLFKSGSADQRSRPNDARTNRKPKLLELSPKLHAFYCEDNGRPAIDPVLLCG